MESLIFVDSNIWCYYFDRSAKEHNAVSKSLEQVLEDGVAINTVVTMEVAHYLIKSLGPEGKRKMDVFLSYPMEELGTRRLMTHDRAFKRLDFIDVVDPVS
jgi:predicted nucleic acid-binding protein